MHCDECGLPIQEWGHSVDPQMHDVGTCQEPECPECREFYDDQEADWDVERRPSRTTHRRTP